jgi:predicted AAA+ superfamily ATPase
VSAELVPPEYVPRIIDGELDALMSGLAAVAVDGAKAVGKTATAARRARTVHQLDDPARQAIAVADPWRLVQAGEPPILLDEWQAVPEVWDAVRRLVDAGAEPGTFLLAGSQSPGPAGDGAEPQTHSGAGRIVSVRMRPLSLAERGIARPTVSLSDLLRGHRPAVGGATRVALADYVDEILRSGFPGLRRLSGRALRAQLDGYLARILDRDIPELGRRVRNPAALRRWLVAYAAAVSTTTSFERIRDAASADDGTAPAKTTVLPYRDALERLWIVEPVQAWLPTRNRFARLARPPKHQLADPALAARLLGVDADALLSGAAAGPPTPRDGTLLGALFESLVTLSLQTYAQATEAVVRHLRTQRGEHEIDLVVVRADERVVALEVKLARTVRDADVAHLLWLRDRLGDDLLDAAVVTTGADAYRRTDGIAVIPAALLGP